MKDYRKRNIIPVGIFFLIFLFMLILSAAIVSGYSYFEVKNRITEIEENTRNYSIPLAEAFADLAELSYRDRNYSKLKKLFRDKINANIIHEAFFVLSDGRIIVHSDKKIEKELKGNIATDEFAYNIDLIMLPIWTKTRSVQMMDYHIYNYDINLPFNSEITKLFKKYIYSKIDVSGWLVTCGVYSKGRGVGCVSFIISKDRIYKFLLEHLNNIRKLSVILLVVSFAVSFLLSIVIFIRYRSLRLYGYSEIKAEPSEPEFVDLSTKRHLKEAIKIKHVPSDIELQHDKRNIKDAVLISNKLRNVK